jgi:hypothetical protein
MTAFTTTYQTHQAIGQREDLQDTIFDISPMDTPFLSGLKRGRAKATTHEWQIDSLADATDDNAQIEGDDITSIPAATPTVRVGNYLQISRKLVLVSGTLDAVDKAGRKNELSYQIAKKGKELKRDLETILLSNHAADAGSSSTGRVFAPLRAWIQTNSSLGSGGANSGHTSGIPSGVDTGSAYAATDGTQRTFTETIFKTVLQSCWTEGADPDLLMVGPANKQLVSTGFSGIATRNIDIAVAAAKPMASIAAIDVYVSDWGAVRIVPNRFQRDRDAWILDMDYVALKILRPMQTIPLAKTGDAEKRMMLIEWTLCVKNEAALGLCADLST